MWGNDSCKLLVGGQISKLAHQLWREIWKHSLTMYTPQDPAFPLPAILIRDILLLHTKRHAQGCSSQDHLQLHKK